jgi:hypothetical protein
MSNQRQKLTDENTQRETRCLALKNFGLSSVVWLLLSGWSALCPKAHAQGGVPLWTNLYERSGSGARALAVAVDSTGNAFVAGPPGGNGVINYSGAGLPLWTNDYNGVVSIAVDGSGNLIGAGSTMHFGGGLDYGTIKYSNDGVPLWTNVYTDQFNDFARAVGVDGAGNVFVTGESAGPSGTVDFGTIKYSSTGVSLWTNYYNGPANSIDSAFAIAVDRSGNVFVTGDSMDASGLWDWATVKYSNSGSLLWVRRYNGPGNGDDHPSAIATDSNGNVFVAGGSTGTASLDSTTIGYSSSGTPLWTNRYAGLGNVFEPQALAVDANGNVFATRSAGFGTIAYSNSGVPLWTNSYGTFYTSKALAVDSAGNVFVTGGNEALTIAYSGSGVPLWTNRYLGPADIEAIAWAVAVDSSNNVVVAGGSRDTNGNSSFVTIKYSAQPVLSPPPLGIQRVDKGILLSWTNAAFGLQSAPTVTGTYTNLPGATSPFTSPISETKQFFRLKAN